MNFDEERDLFERLEREYLSDKGLSEERLEEIGAYTLDDPKHPDHYSIHADIWDAREGK